MSCPKNCPGRSVPHHCKKPSDDSSSLRDQLRALGKENKHRSRHVAPGAKQRWHRLVAETSHVGNIAQKPVKVEKPNSTAPPGGAKTFMEKSYHEQVAHMHRAFFSWNEENKLEREQEKHSRDCVVDIDDEMYIEMYRAYDAELWRSTEIEGKMDQAYKQLEIAEKSTGHTKLKWLVHASLYFDQAFELARQHTSVVSACRLSTAHEFAKFLWDHQKNPKAAYSVLHHAYCAAKNYNDSLVAKALAHNRSKVRRFLVDGVPKLLYDSDLGLDFPYAIMAMDADLITWAEDPRMSSVTDIVLEVSMNDEGQAVTNLAGDIIVQFGRSDLEWLTWSHIWLAAGQWCGDLCAVKLLCGGVVVGDELLGSGALQCD